MIVETGWWDRNYLVSGGITPETVPEAPGSMVGTHGRII